MVQTAESGLHATTATDLATRLLHLRSAETRAPESRSSEAKKFVVTVTKCICVCVSVWE